MSNVVHLFSKRTKSLKEENRKPSRHHGVQLSLPFDARRVLFVICGSINVADVEFYHFSAQTEILAIFDLRFSPRLDFVAASRSRALSRLLEYEVSYFDVFGRAGISTLASALNERFEILKEIISEAEVKLDPSRPCLMIFDSQGLAAEYVKSMQDYFEVRQINAGDIRDVAAEHLRLEM